MSTLKTTNLQNASAASPAFVLASDGSATANLSSLNGGPIAGTRNRVINGDMRIDQRNAGASVTPTNATNTYVVDRWSYYVSQPSKLTSQQSTVVPTGFTNSLLTTSSSAYSVGINDLFIVRQKVEGFNAADFGWGAAGAQSITVSFWVRSSLTGTFGGAIKNDDATRAYPFSYAISSANTWEQKSLTVLGDTTGTWLKNSSTGIQLVFGLGAGSNFSGTAGAWASGDIHSATGATSVVGTSGATFYVTGVQLEPGTVATPFERRSYGQELALCQRYYQRTTAETASATLLTGVICSGASSGNGGFNLIGIMRTTPTLDSSTASAFAYSDGVTGTACTAISLAGSQSNSKIAAINFSTAGSLTQFRSYRIEANSSTTAFLGFSSEL